MIWSDTRRNYPRGHRWKHDLRGGTGGKQGCVKIFCRITHKSLFRARKSLNKFRPIVPSGFLSYFHILAAIIVKRSQISLQRPCCVIHTSSLTGHRIWLTHAQICVTIVSPLALKHPKHAALFLQYRLNFLNLSWLFWVIPGVCDHVPWTHMPPVHWC